MVQDASALIAAGTVNAGQMNRACMDVPITIHPVDAAALLNIKSTLGVTYTTWTATSPCRLFGSSVGFPGEWNGVWCNGDGKAVLLSLTSNFFNYRIDSFTSSMKALPNLVDIEAPYNYLMGTVPPVGASLVVLNMAFNFLTDFPTFSCTTCGGNNNCLTTPSKCPSRGTVQRAAAECVYCGTNGVPPLCWGAGGVCTVDASVPIAAGTGSKALTTPLARTCVSNGCGRAAHVAIGGVCGGSGGAAALPAEGGGRGGAVGPASTPQGPYPAPTCSPMLTLKSLLGVTFTSWAASVPCKIAGQSTTVTTWSGVLCDSTGSVLSIGVSNANLKGSLPAAVSLLSALTYLGVASNCLTGTVPALSSGLCTLDVRYNFLTDVPAVTYTYCGGNNNCLLTPSKCATAGSTQRPTADCAICGTTNAVGPFCTASGGVYMPDAAANVAAGTVNAPVLPLLFMGCTGGTNYMYPSDAVALLNIKSAMGLTFTSWATTTPCLAEGTSPNWDEWERVTCTPFGRLYSMRLRCNYLMGTLPASITNFKSLDIAAALLNIKSTLGVAYTTWTATSPCRLFGSSVGFSGEWNGVWCNGDGKAVLFAVDGLGLKGSLHADMSALTALTRVSLMSNFFNYRIDSFTSSMKDLPNLVDIRMHINYLYGEIPSFLVNIPKITQLEAPYNYLMGTVPPVRAGLVVLNMAFNFLTDFPTFSYSTCGGNNNCLTTPSKCPSGGTEECARWTLSVPTAAGTGSKSLTTPLARTCVGGAVVGIKVSNGCGRAAHVVNGGSLKGVMVMRAVGVACHAGPQVFAGRHIHQLGGKCAVHAGLAEHHIHNLEWRGLRLQYNYLFGEVPSFLVGLPKLTQLYVPLATGLLTLDARFNYLTDLPTAAYKSCSGNNNFLVTPSKCNAAGTVQRTAAECSFYGTTNGVGPFCTATGGACMVNAYDNVDGGIVNSATQPAVPLFCLFPPVAMKDSAAMLAIKSSLGVTYTTWAASVPCKLPGQIARVAIWTGVSCDSTGSVVGIGLENANLLGSLAMEISTLSALTYLSLSANLLNYRIDSFTTYLRFLPVLADIGAMNNYLMGSIPALASGLRTLDIRYNFIADLPAVTYSSYNGTGNCLIAPSKCGSSGIDQRPPAECAFCSSTNAMGPYCWGGGGVCTVDAFVYVFGSYVNAGSTPGLATCVGGTVVAIQESAAMLALKSSLGITTNTWAASVACTLKGTTAPVPTWAGVLYDSSGNVVSIEMKNTGLAGAPPADISKLTTLTYLNLNSQLFQAPLTDFTSNLLKLTGLKELYLQYNWFFGSVPTALLRLPSLCVLGLGFNYLTGSFPGSATLVTLDIRSNFFYTMAPMTLKWCDGSNNCLASPAPCASGGSTQRAAADCAICASVGAVPPFCRGTGTCSPDSGPAAALGTPNSATAPIAAHALVLLTLKSTLSVTLSNWNAASLCTLEGQTLLPAQWGGVRCTAAGKRWSGSTCNVGAGAALAVPHALCLSLIHRLSCSSLSLPRSALTRQSLQSILHLDISKLTTLTYLDLGYNLFQGRLDLFAAPLKPLTTLKALFFHYNYFAGSIPSAIATLPQLTSLGLFSNYLTGTVPIPSKALVALDVGFNFLSGTFPKLPLMFCAGDNNCFLNSTACRTYGIVQRPAGACAICGTVAGQGDLCFGGSCAPLASAAVTASTVNSPNQPILPMACADNPAAPMDTGSALALLNVKSALGVTFTSWLAASPCAIANSTIAVAGTWTGVLCSSAGDVLSVNLSSAVAGTIHTDITKLNSPHLPVSALTYLDLSNNFLRGSLDKFVTFSGLKTLLQLDVHANALTGSFPAVSSVLRALYLHDNFLAGSFTTSSLTACDPSLNCFLNAVACGATSTTQRAAAACAICDSPAAQGQLCWGGTCMPKVSPTTAHPDGLAPAGHVLRCTTLPIHQFCMLEISQALGALKNVMGVTFTTSDPATYCTVAPTAHRPRHVGRQLANSKLTGTLPLSVSALTALTAMVAWTEVATQLRLLTNLKSIDLAYNWLSSSVPAYMLTLPSLTELTIGYNYLTGALPPVTPPLSVVDVQFNFLAGTFPMLTLTLCAARMNCFHRRHQVQEPQPRLRAPTSCRLLRHLQHHQRAGPPVHGGVCTVNATDLVALGAPNSAASPSLPLICVGAAFVAMDAVHAGANAQHQGVAGLQPAAGGGWNSFTASIKTPLVLKELLVTATCHRSFALQFKLPVRPVPHRPPRPHHSLQALRGLQLPDGPLPTVPASAKSLDVQATSCQAPSPPTRSPTATPPPTASPTPTTAPPSASPSASATDCAICGTRLWPGHAMRRRAVPRQHHGGHRASHCHVSPLQPLLHASRLGHQPPALKTVLGVTATEWSATTGGTEAQGVEEQQRAALATMVGACTVEGRPLLLARGPASSATPLAPLSPCECPPAVSLMLLPNQKLTGSLSTDIRQAHSSHCAALPRPPPVTPHPPLFQLCRFHSPPSIPPTAAHNKLNRNYLTGVVPAMGAAVKVLNMAGNFLSASFPTTGVTACDARSNCFTDASKCANTLGTAQRATADCNVCGSTGAAGPLCGGGFCIPNAAAPAAAGTPNIEGQALLTMSCVGGPIEVNMRGAMLNLKASLGVTLTDWAAASPCTIAGQPSVPGAWTNVVCDTAGKVVSIDLTNQLLKGSMHADITKLTILTSFNAKFNYLAGPLPVRAAHSAHPHQPVTPHSILTPPSLHTSRIAAAAHVLPSTAHILRLPHTSTFYHPIPSCTKRGSLLTPLPVCAPATSTHAPLAVPTASDVSYSYLTGTVPALGTALKNLRIGGNYLSGSIGTLSGVTCSALFNCLTSQGSCTTGGTQNRVGCAICGSTNAQSTLCGGGMCVPDATAAVESNTTPTLSTPAVPMYCTGVIMDATAGDALLPCPALPPILPHNVFHPSPPHPCAWWLAAHQPPSLSIHAMNLNNQRLTGSFHADISKLSLLTVLERPWGHVLVAALLAAIMPFPPLASLPAPSAAARAGIELNMNALTGTFPAPISTALKRLLVDRNFMAGTFPANSATYCTAYGNCIFSYTMCNSLYPNSPVGNCNYCGTTMGWARRAWATPAALQAMVPGLWTQPMCTLAGQAYVPGMLPLAFGNPAGMVLDMYAPFAHRPARPLLAPFSHPARPLAPCSRPSRALRAPCSPLLAPCSPCPHQPSTLLSAHTVTPLMGCMPHASLMRVGCLSAGCAHDVLTSKRLLPTDSSKLSALTKL
ncbi:unnamed protein product [Closterium sp. NIES-64]|nr:unnamed protein product [Closterium sp. NIES-64]